MEPFAHCFRNPSATKIPDVHHYMADPETLHLSLVLPFLHSSPANWGCWENARVQTSSSTACYLWHWASQLTLFSLSFLICKMDFYRLRRKKRGNLCRTLLAHNKHHLNVFCCYYYSISKDNHPITPLSVTLALCSFILAYKIGQQNQVPLIWI